MQLDTISQTFKALSDPIRLKIVYLLADVDSLCVCEIMASLQLSQSTTSRHLAYLKNSNLVTAERQGVWMHYQLNKNALNFIKMKTLMKQLNEDEAVKELQAEACASEGCTAN